MQFSSSRQIFAFGLTAGVFALGAGFSACSSSPSPPATSANTAGGGDSGGAGSDATTTSAPDSGAGDDGGTANVDGNTVSTAAGSCPNPTVGIVFSPMYSAFIPGSTLHTFQIPAITDDGNTATWSVSDPTQAQLSPQAFDTNPGVMITIQGVGTGSTGDAGEIGQLTVIATESNGACGSATLNITTAAESDWTIGDMRYNDGIALTLARPDGGGFGGPRPDGGFGEGGPGMGMGMGMGGMGGILRMTDAGSYYEEDGGTACTNCHGPTATNGPYKDVSHTPEQTGGFSDNDLIQIITQGNIPDGGYFDPSVITPTCDSGAGAACYEAAYARWHSFHQWNDITSDEFAGIVVYLRSLEPEAQNGTAANFGGGGRRRDGGGGMGMMGPPPADAGTAPADAGSE